MNLTLISAVAAFMLGFGSAYNIQQGKIEHAENTRLQQAAEDQQRIHALEQARSTQVITAQDNNRKRQVTRSTELASVGLVGNGLRLATDSAVRDAQTNPDACPDKAATLAVVFAECQSALLTMGTDAEEWFSEYQLMIEAAK